VYKLSEDFVSNIHNLGISTLQDACVKNRDKSRRFVCIDARETWYSK
jgi:hypothetical protein